MTTPDASSIRAVNLVSVGADTHQSNMSQHFIPLSFTAGQGSLTVQTPSSAAIAPYGNYMLFILNEKGVPSVSAPLNLSAAPEAPGAPTNVIATASGTTATVTWGVPFQGTSAITSYTVTPYVGETAQQPTVVSGTPPAATATITGLTSGVTYTFKVAATNAVGTGPVLGAVEPDHDLQPHRAGRPHGRVGHPRQRQRERELDGTQLQRQPDHQLHHHPLRGHHRADAHDRHRYSARHQPRR